MWTLIALAICLTWAAILKAQGYPWSTVIMRPLIGLGALMLATVFHAIAFVALSRKKGPSPTPQMRGGRRPLFVTDRSSRQHRER